MIRIAIHRLTGEFAIIKKSSRGLVLAQFTRFEHRHSHGWHLYVRRDFKVWKRK